MLLENINFLISDVISTGNTEYFNITQIPTKKCTILFNLYNDFLESGYDAGQLTSDRWFFSDDVKCLLATLRKNTDVVIPAMRDIQDIVDKRYF